jgi:uncharacterized protein (TIGR03435 family)
MTNAFFRGVPFLLLAATVAHSQGVTQPSFEVAAIKPSAPLSSQVPGFRNRSEQVDLYIRMAGGGMKADPAQVRFTYKTLEELICLAFSLKPFQISAPKGMSGTRYDIAAKMPARASTDSVPEMLQSLLKDRFKLTSHRANKDFEVYVLSVGAGGLKIPQKPADYKFDRTATALPQTLESLGNALSRAMGRPVLDQTTLQGEFMVPKDFQSLVNKAIIGQIVPDRGGDEDMEVPSAGAIRRALAALGLGLNPSKRPLPILVVDHVEKTPTEN